MQSYGKLGAPPNWLEAGLEAGSEGGESANFRST